MRGLVPALAIVFAISATQAHSDPITAVYDVHVMFRYTTFTDETLAEHVNYRFPLRLTFDPPNAVPSPFGSNYGPATFSPVPLALPSPPPNLPLTTGNGTYHTSSPQGGDFEGLFLRYAFAGYSAESPLPDDEEAFYGAYGRHLILGSYVTRLPVKSRISARTFPVHLGIPHNEFNSFNANFTYEGWLFLDSDPYNLLAPNSFTYQGYAKLIETTAVPEPATILLTGAGIAVLGQRPWRHRRSRHRMARALLTELPRFQNS